MNDFNTGGHAVPASCVTELREKEVLINSRCSVHQAEISMCSNSLISLSVKISLADEGRAISCTFREKHYFVMPAQFLENEEAILREP